MFNSASIIYRLYAIPAIIVAFTLHEYMHAYVSHRLGDPTPEMNGRLTLDPLAHVDFVGFIMVILMGFGWAKPVPINPNNYVNRRKGRILVSLAGPFTNLALAFVFSAIFYFAYDAIVANEIVYNIYQPFVTINIMLFAFNMIPIPPLDGFSLLEIFIHPSKFKTLMQIRRYGFIALIVLAMVGVLGMYIRFVNFIVFEKLFISIFKAIEYLIALIG